MRPLFCLFILSLLAGCNVRLPPSSTAKLPSSTATPSASEPTGTAKP